MVSLLTGIIAIFCTCFKASFILLKVSDNKRASLFAYHRRFVDLENGEEIRLHPNEIKISYLNALNNWRHQIQRKCAQYHTDLIDKDIQQGFDQILKTYLTKSNKMA